MEIPVRMQLIQLLAALAAGFVIGVMHDLLAMLRLRRSRAEAELLDGVLCAGIWLTLFCLGMWIGGGRQRLFLTAFAALGAAAYLMLLAPLVRPLLGCTADAAGWVLYTAFFPFKMALSGAGKLQKSLQNLSRQSINVLNCFGE